MRAKSNRVILALGHRGNDFPAWAGPCYLVESSVHAIIEAGKGRRFQDASLIKEITPLFG